MRVYFWLALTLVSTFLLICVGATVGDYPLDLSTVLSVMWGGGTPIERAVVLDLRLGRGIVGAAVGACLAYSGALTQSVARNPLASPDILGITNGASLAAALVIVFGSSGSIVSTSIGIPLAAVCGSLVTALVIWLIAGRARRDLMRLVLIGVGVSIFLSALTTWLLAWAELDRAVEARMWLTGSLNGRDYSNAWAPLLVLFFAVAAAGWLAFQLAALSLGETTAHVLGHHVPLAQAAQLLTAVALAAVAVSAAGPISFLAFVTPQIARRLAGTPTPPLLLSASTGALLLVAADLCTRVVVPWELPVGVLTAFLGAPVLLYLLLTGNRKARA